MTAALAQRYLTTRSLTESLASGLSDEDQLLQSMPLASPTKWHRAHTTWFFEAFVLGPAGIGPVDPRYGHLFNSYYEALGDRVARDKRGLLSRPSVREVGDYRRAVDERVVSLIERTNESRRDDLAKLVELGIHHEQQHQELLLTDILSAFFENPMGPVYRDGVAPDASAPSPSMSWCSFDGGLVEIGSPSDGFAFDNERPRHQVYLPPFAVASRPIVVREVKAFISANGYHTPSLWLSEGYSLARSRGWEAPQYSRFGSATYETFTLRGWRIPSDDEPATHLSFWEAEAIARFLGARLPTETEWEHASASLAPAEGNFADGELVPLPTTTRGLAQLFGDVWEWTRSSYEPYPGYEPAAGALGEYNGKFMAQQMVLRGGSCLTPRGHVRPSYRNFWHPDTRFQMSGARLARHA